MTGFVVYPMLDEDYNFPTEVRQAMANSTEIATKIALAGAGKISDTQKGVAGGVAQLDSGTKLPDGLMPDRLSSTSLIALISSSAPANLDGGNASSVYTGTFNFDGGTA